MIGLLIGSIFIAQVLGNEDFNLQILDPRTKVENNISGGQEEKIKIKEGKLTLSISSATIDFGLVEPASPVIRDSRIQAALFPSEKSAALFVFEDHPLTNDTTCDDGNCREYVASVWDNPLVYGFGVSFDGTNYQQFANEALGEIKREVISINSSNQDIKAIYKLNVGRTQNPGNYSNTVTYLLIPNF